MDKETGKVSDLSEKETIKIALDHMAEALCFGYQLKTDEGKAFCFMLDSAIKYGAVIFNNGDVLEASADFTDYEGKVHRKKLKVMK